MKATKKEPSALHAEGSRIAVRLSRERYKYNTGGVLVSRALASLWKKGGGRRPEGSIPHRLRRSPLFRKGAKGGGARDKTRPVSRLPRRRPVGGEGCG